MSGVGKGTGGTEYNGPGEESGASGVFKPTELPQDLQNFFSVVVGLRWPEANLQGMILLRDFWHDYGAAVEELLPQLRKAREKFDAGMDGESSGQLLRYIDDELIPQAEGLAEVGAELKSMVGQTAADVEKSMIMLVAFAVIALISFIALLYSVMPFLAGLVVTAFREVGKAILKGVLLRLLQQALAKAGPAALAGLRELFKKAPHILLNAVKFGVGGAAFMAGLDATIQGIQLAPGGLREKFDSESVWKMGAGGAIGGAGAGVVSGIGRTLSKQFPKVPKNYRAIGNAAHALGQALAIVLTNPLVFLATGDKDGKWWEGMLGEFGPLDHAGNHGKKIAKHLLEHLPGLADTHGLTMRTETDAPPPEGGGHDSKPAPEGDSDSEVGQDFSEKAGAGRDGDLTADDARTRSESAGDADNRSVSSSGHSRSDTAVDTSTNSSPGGGAVRQLAVTGADNQQFGTLFTQEQSGASSQQVPISNGQGTQAGGAGSGQPRGSQQSVPAQREGQQSSQAPDSRPRTSTNGDAFQPSDAASARSAHGNETGQETLSRPVGPREQAVSGEADVAPDGGKQPSGHEYVPDDSNQIRTMSERGPAAEAEQPGGFAGQQEGSPSQERGAGGGASPDAPPVSTTQRPSSQQGTPEAPAARAPGGEPGQGKGPERTVESRLTDLVPEHSLYQQRTASESHAAPEGAPEPAGRQADGPSPDPAAAQHHDSPGTDQTDAPPVVSPGSAQTPQKSGVEQPVVGRSSAAKPDGWQPTSHPSGRESSVDGALAPQRGPGEPVVSKAGLESDGPAEPVLVPGSDIENGLAGFADEDAPPPPYERPPPSYAELLGLPPGLAGDKGLGDKGLTVSSEPVKARPGHGAARWLDSLLGKQDGGLTELETRELVRRTVGDLTVFPVGLPADQLQGADAGVGSSAAGEGGGGRKETKERAVALGTQLVAENRASGRDTDWKEYKEYLRQHQISVDNLPRAAIARYLRLAKDQAGEPTRVRGKGVGREDLKVRVSRYLMENPEASIRSIRVDLFGEPIDGIKEGVDTDVLRSVVNEVRGELGIPGPQLPGLPKSSAIPLVREYYAEALLANKKPTLAGLVSYFRAAGSGLGLDAAVGHLREVGGDLAILTRNLTGHPESRPEPGESSDPPPAAEPEPERQPTTAQTADNDGADPGTAAENRRRDAGPDFTPARTLGGATMADRVSEVGQVVGDLRRLLPEASKVTGMDAVHTKLAERPEELAGGTGKWFEVTAGGRKLDVLVRTEFDFGQAREPGADSPGQVSGRHESSDRAGELNRTLHQDRAHRMIAVMPTPGLGFFGAIKAVATFLRPSTTRDETVTREAGHTIEYEVPRRLHNAEVPFRTVVSVFDRGIAIAQERTLGPSPTLAPMTVPETVPAPQADGWRVAGRRLPRAGVIDVHLDPHAPATHKGKDLQRPGIFDKIESYLRKVLPRLGEAERKTVQEFLSDATVARNLQSMEITPTQQEDGASGWLDVGTLVKGANWFKARRTIRAQVQMRVVTRRYQHVEDVDGLKVTRTQREGDGVANTTSATHEKTLELAGGALGELGVVKPAGGGQVMSSGSHAHQFTSKARNTGQDVKTTTENGVIWLAESDVEVRVVGRPPITFRGALTSYRVTTAEEARATGIVAAPDGPTLEGERQPSSPPAVLHRAMLEHTGAGERLAKLVIETLRKVPEQGEKRLWKWGDTDFLVDPDAPVVTGRLSRELAEQVGRATEARRKLRDDQLGASPVTTLAFSHEGTGHTDHVLIEVTREIETAVRGDQVDGPRGPETVRSTEGTTDVTRRVKKSFGGALIGRFYFGALGITQLLDVKSGVTMTTDRSTRISRSVETETTKVVGHPGPDGTLGNEPYRRYTGTVRYGLDGVFWREDKDVVTEFRSRRAGVPEKLVFGDGSPEASSIEVDFDTLVSDVDTLIPELSRPRDPRVSEPRPLDDVAINHDGPPATDRLRRTGDRRLDGVRTEREDGAGRRVALGQELVGKVARSPLDGSQLARIKAGLGAANGFGKFSVFDVSPPPVTHGSGQRIILAESNMMLNPQELGYRRWTDTTHTMTGATVIESRDGRQWSFDPFKVEGVLVSIGPHSGPGGAGIVEGKPVSWQTSRTAGQRAEPANVTTRGSWAEPEYLVSVTKRTLQVVESSFYGKAGRRTLNRHSPAWTRLSEGPGPRPRDETTRAAHQFHEENVLVWLTADQLAAVRENADLEQQRLLLEELPFPDPGTETPQAAEVNEPPAATARTIPWRPGLKLPTTPIDLTEAIPELRRALAEHSDIGPDTANRIFEPTPARSKHDNHARAEEVLANAHQHLDEAGNGHLAVPLPVAEKASRQTYELWIQARQKGFARPGEPAPGGLAFTNRLTETSSHARGRNWTHAVVAATTFGLVTLTGEDSDVSHPGAGVAGAGGTTEHHYGVVKTETETETAGTDEQTATISGSRERTTAELEFDISVRRGGTVYAHVQLVREVAMDQPVEEEFSPAPPEERLGRIGDTAIRKQDVSPQALRRWHREPGHLAAPDPGKSFVEEVYTDPDRLAAIAGQGIAEGGGTVSKQVHRELAASFGYRMTKNGLLRAMGDDGLPIPVNPALGLDLALHARPGKSARLGVPSERVELGGKPTETTKETNKTAFTSHHHESAVLLGPMGAGLPVLPALVRPIAEGGTASKSEHTREQDNTPRTWDKPIPDEAKLTGSWLEDLEFLLVVKPTAKFGLKHAVVAEFPAENAARIRRADRNDRIPSYLAEATRIFAQRDQVWNDAARRFATARWRTRQTAELDRLLSLPRPRSQNDTARIEVLTSQGVRAADSVGAAQAARDAEDALVREADSRRLAKSAYGAAILRAHEAVVVKPEPDATIAADRTNLQRLEDDTRLHRIAQHLLDWSGENHAPRLELRGFGDLTTTDAVKDHLRGVIGRLDDLVGLAGSENGHRPTLSELGVHVHISHVSADGPVQAQVWLDKGERVDPPGEDVDEAALDRYRERLEELSGREPGEAAALSGVREPVLPGDPGAGSRDWSPREVGEFVARARAWWFGSEGMGADRGSAERLWRDLGPDLGSGGVRFDSGRRDAAIVAVAFAEHSGFGPDGLAELVGRLRQWAWVPGGTGGAGPAPGGPAAGVAGVPAESREAIRTWRPDRGDPQAPLTLLAYMSRLPLGNLSLAISGVRRRYPQEVIELVQPWVLGMHSETDPATGAPYASDRVALLSGGVVAYRKVDEWWREEFGAQPVPTESREAIRTWRPDSDHPQAPRTLLEYMSRLPLGRLQLVTDSRGRYPAGVIELIRPWVLAMKGWHNPVTGKPASANDVAGFSGEMVRSGAIAEWWRKAGLGPRGDVRDSTAVGAGAKRAGEADEAEASRKRRAEDGQPESGQEQANRERDLLLPGAAGSGSRMLDQGRTELYRADEPAGEADDLRIVRVVSHNMTPMRAMNNAFPFRDPNDPQGRVYEPYADENGQLHSAVVRRADEITAEMIGTKAMLKGIARDPDDTRLPATAATGLTAVWPALERAVAAEMRRLVREEPLATPVVRVGEVTEKHVREHERALVGENGLFLSRRSADIPPAEWPSLRNGRILGVYLGAVLDSGETLANWEETYRKYPSYAMKLAKTRNTMSAEGAANFIAFANTATEDSGHGLTYDHDRINAVFVKFRIHLFDKGENPRAQTIAVLMALDNAFDRETNPDGVILVDYGDDYLSLLENPVKAEPEADPDVSRYPEVPHVDAPTADARLSQELQSIALSDGSPGAGLEPGSEEYFSVLHHAVVTEVRSLARRGSGDIEGFVREHVTPVVVERWFWETEPDPYHVKGAASEIAKAVLGFHGLLGGAPASVGGSAGTRALSPGESEAGPSSIPGGGSEHLAASKPSGGGRRDLSEAEVEQLYPDSQPSSDQLAEIERRDDRSELPRGGRRIDVLFNTGGPLPLSMHSRDLEEVDHPARKSRWMVPDGVELQRLAEARDPESPNYRPEWAGLTVAQQWALLAAELRGEQFHERDREQAIWKIRILNNFGARYPTGKKARAELEEIADLAHEKLKSWSTVTNLFPNKMVPEGNGGKVSLMRLLADGEPIRNRWETGSSGGTADISDRVTAEWLFGYSSSFKNSEPVTVENPAEMPRYGAVIPPSRVEGSAVHYGTVVVQWNEDVRARSTFTPGDSMGMDTDTNAVTYTDKEHLYPLLAYGDDELVRHLLAEATDYRYDPSLKDAPGPSTHGFLEAQIHGPLDLSHAKKVVINWGAFGLSDNDQPNLTRAEAEQLRDDLRAVRPGLDVELGKEIGEPGRAELVERNRVRGLYGLDASSRLDAQDLEVARKLDRLAGGGPFAGHASRQDLIRLLTVDDPTRLDDEATGRMLRELFEVARQYFQDPEGLRAAAPERASFFDRLVGESQPDAHPDAEPRPSDSSGYVRAEGNRVVFPAPGVTMETAVSAAAQLPVFPGVLTVGARLAADGSGVLRSDGQGVHSFAEFAGLLQQWLPESPEQRRVLLVSCYASELAASLSRFLDAAVVATRELVWEFNKGQIVAGDVRLFDDGTMLPAGPRNSPDVNLFELYKDGALAQSLDTAVAGQAVLRAGWASAEARADDTTSGDRLTEPLHWGEEYGAKWRDVRGGSAPSPENILLVDSALNHILDRHSGGSAVSGKSRFPAEWTAGDIRKHVLDVAKNPDVVPRVAKGTGTWAATGVRAGVAIEVVVESPGIVVTGYPLEGKGVQVDLPDIGIAEAELTKLVGKHNKRDLGDAWSQARGGRPPGQLTVKYGRLAAIRGNTKDVGEFGSSAFPPDWSAGRTVDRLLDVARKPDQPPRPLDKGGWRATGTRDGMQVVAFLTEHGEVFDGYAQTASGQGVAESSRKRPRHGEEAPSRAARRPKREPGETAPAAGSRGFTSVAELAGQLKSKAVDPRNHQSESSRTMGPDYFSRRKAPSAAGPVRGHDYSALNAAGWQALLTKLDLASPVRFGTDEYAPDRMTGFEDAVLTRELTDAERVQWAPTSEKPPLPRVLEMPKTVISTWFGNPLPDEQSPNFRSSVARMAGELVRDSTFVHVTNVSRESVERAKDGESGKYFDDVRELVRWARDNNIILIDIYEVFNKDHLMVLQEFFEAEMARQAPGGYGAASDMARLELLKLMGGVHLDGGDRLTNVDPLDIIHAQQSFAIRESPDGKELDQRLLAAPRNHPFLDSSLEQIRQDYLTHEGDRNDRDNAPERMRHVREIAEDSRTATLRLTQRVVHTLVWKLHSSEGKLDLTKVVPALDRHPKPELVLGAALEFIFGRPELVAMVKEVIEPGREYSVPVPRNARDLFKRGGQDGGARIVGSAEGSVPVRTRSAGVPESARPVGSAGPESGGPDGGGWRFATGERAPWLHEIRFGFDGGQHIIDNHAAGSGHPGKTEFPHDWVPERLLDNVLDAAKFPDSTPELLRTGKWRARGERDGVLIEVIADPFGEVISAFPQSGEGVVLNAHRGPRLEDVTIANLNKRHSGDDLAGEWTKVQGGSNFTEDVAKPTSVLMSMRVARDILETRTDGIAPSGNTTFPESWSDLESVERVLQVAHDPGVLPRLRFDGRWEVVGTRAGVEIEVLLDPDGAVWKARPRFSTASRRGEEELRSALRRRLGETAAEKLLTTVKRFDAGLAWAYRRVPESLRANLKEAADRMASELLRVPKAVRNQSFEAKLKSALKQLLSPGRDNESVEKLVRKIWAFDPGLAWAYDWAPEEVRKDPTSLAKWMAEMLVVGKPLKLLGGSERVDGTGGPGSPDGPSVGRLLEESIGEASDPDGPDADPEFRERWVPPVTTGPAGWLLAELNEATPAEPARGGVLPEPDLFGLLAPAEPPEFLRGHDHSGITVGQGLDLVRKLDLKHPAPDWSELAPDNLQDFDDFVLTRELSEQERHGWAENAGPLPARLQLLRARASIWLGGPLDTGSAAKFEMRENIAASQRELRGWAPMAVFTDVPRASFERAGRFSDEAADGSLTGVREMLSWAEENDVLLVNVHEVFHSGWPMPVQEAFLAELAKQSKPGYTAASDLLRMALVQRFGLLYSDGEYETGWSELAEMQRVLGSREGYGVHKRGEAFNNDLVVVPKGHPYADDFFESMRENYGMRQAEVHPAPSSLGAEAFVNVPELRSKRYSVESRTGPVNHRKIVRELGHDDPARGAISGPRMTTGGQWLVRPRVRPSIPLSDREATVELTKKVVQTLVRELYNRDGDLHLTLVADGVLRHETPEVIWTAALGYLAQRPEFAEMVRTVTDRELAFTPGGPHEQRRVELPERAQRYLRDVPGDEFHRLAEFSRPATMVPDSSVFVRADGNRVVFPPPGVTLAAAGAAAAQLPALPGVLTVGARLTPDGTGVLRWDRPGGHGFAEFAGLLRGQLPKPPAERRILLVSCDSAELAKVLSEMLDAEVIAPAEQVWQANGGLLRPGPVRIFENGEMSPAGPRNEPDSSQWQLYEHGDLRRSLGAGDAREAVLGAGWATTEHLADGPRQVEGDRLAEPIHWGDDDSDSDVNMPDAVDSDSDGEEAGQARFDLTDNAVIDSFRDHIADRVATARADLRDNENVPEQLRSVAGTYARRWATALIGPMPDAAAADANVRRLGDLHQQVTDVLAAEILDAASEAEAGALRDAWDATADIRDDYERLRRRLRLGSLPALDELRNDPDVRVGLDRMRAARMVAGGDLARWAAVGQASGQDWRQQRQAGDTGARTENQLYAADDGMRAAEARRQQDRVAAQWREDGHGLLGIPGAELNEQERGLVDELAEMLGHRSHLARGRRDQAVQDAATEELAGRLRHRFTALRDQEGADQPWEVVEQRLAGELGTVHELIERADSARDLLAEGAPSQQQQNRVRGRAVLGLIDEPTDTFHLTRGRLLSLLSIAMAAVVSVENTTRGVVDAEWRATAGLRTRVAALVNEGGPQRVDFDVPFSVAARRLHPASLAMAVAGWHEHWSWDIEGGDWLLTRERLAGQAALRQEAERLLGSPYEPRPGGPGPETARWVRERAVAAVAHRVHLGLGAAGDAEALRLRVEHLLGHAEGLAVLQTLLPSTRQTVSTLNETLLSGLRSTARAMLGPLGAPTPAPGAERPMWYAEVYRALVDVLAVRLHAEPSTEPGWTRTASLRALLETWFNWDGRQRVNFDVPYQVARRRHTAGSVTWHVAGFENGWDEALSEGNALLVRRDPLLADGELAEADRLLGVPPEPRAGLGPSAAEQQRLWQRIRAAVAAEWQDDPDAAGPLAQNLRHGFGRLHGYDELAGTTEAILPGVAGEHRNARRALDAADPERQAEVLRYAEAMVGPPSTVVPGVGPSAAAQQLHRTMLIEIVAGFLLTARETDGDVRLEAWWWSENIRQGLEYLRTWTPSGPAVAAPDEGYLVDEDAVAGRIEVVDPGGIEQAVARFERELSEHAFEGEARLTMLRREDEELLTEGISRMRAEDVVRDEHRDELLRLIGSGDDHPPTAEAMRRQWNRLRIGALSGAPLARAITEFRHPADWLAAEGARLMGVADQDLTRSPADSPEGRRVELLRDIARVANASSAPEASLNSLRRQWAGMGIATSAGAVLDEQITEFRTGFSNILGQYAIRWEDGLTAAELSVASTLEERARQLLGPYELAAAPAGSDLTPQQAQGLSGISGQVAERLYRTMVAALVKVIARHPTATDHHQLLAEQLRSGQVQGMPSFDALLSWHRPEPDRVAAADPVPPYTEDALPDQQWLQWAGEALGPRPELDPRTDGEDGRITGSERGRVLAAARLSNQYDLMVHAMALAGQYSGVEAAYALLAAWRARMEADLPGPGTGEG